VVRPVIDDGGTRGNAERGIGRDRARRLDPDRTRDVGARRYAIDITCEVTALPPEPARFAHSVPPRHALFFDKWFIP
jgi:hypothetical protein